MVFLPFFWIRSFLIVFLHKKAVMIGLLHALRVLRMGFCSAYFVKNWTCQKLKSYVHFETYYDQYVNTYWRLRIGLLHEVFTLALPTFIYPTMTLQYFANLNEKFYHNPTLDWQYQISVQYLPLPDKVLALVWNHLTNNDSTSILTLQTWTTLQC